MYCSKSVLCTWLALTVVFIFKPTVSALSFRQDVPISNVSAIDRGFRFYILEKIVQKVDSIGKKMTETAKTCQDEFVSITKDCEKCEEGCEGQKPITNVPISTPTLLLSYKLIKNIAFEAPKTLNAFGKASLVYLKDVGDIAKQLGSVLSKEDDQTLKSRGKNLNLIGKQLKESSIRLLRESANGFKRATDEVLNDVKVTLQDIQDNEESLKRSTGGKFDDIGEFASKGVDKNDDRFSRKIDADVPMDGHKIQHRQIDHRNKDHKEHKRDGLPAINLPRITLPPIRTRRVNLPRLELPAIRLPAIRWGERRRRRRGGWWGKKRRSSSFDCDCPFCGILRSIESEKGKVGMVCGDSFLTQQAQTIKELNALTILNSFVMKNVILTKITLDSRFSRIDHEKATMTLNTPQDKRIKIKMKKGIPTAGSNNIQLSEADVVGIIQAEAPAVYRALLRKAI